MLTGSGTVYQDRLRGFAGRLASIGFTGNIALNGLIEDQNNAALGFGTTTGFNGGTVTVGPLGELAVSGAIEIFNPITLNGGYLSANGNTNSGIFNNTVTVTAASIFAPVSSRALPLPRTSPSTRWPDRAT